MAINEDIIKTWYLTKNEENRATQSKADSIEFIFTKKILEKYINKQSNVIEIGCGTGYYGMFLSDKCKKYTGIDITPEHIELFKRKIGIANIKNIETSVGDATDLKNINNNEYDIVLVLGPMYHLPPNERDLVFLEAKRICKDNGIIIFAYINKLGVYLYGALSVPDIYPNEKAFDYALLKEIDDIHPDKIYYTTPEKMDNSAKKHGLEVIKNIGVDFIFDRNQINDMDEEKFNNWLKYLEYLYDNEYCTGLSNHCLLICKKENST